jgi:hypothetical protein
VDPPPPPSNRSFGTLFVAVFAIVGVVVVWRGGSYAVGWFALSALTLAVTLVRPAWLAPLNRAWMRLARVLERIVSPVVLGVMYYALLAPVGIAMRWAGRDPMKRRFDAEAASYWEARTPPGPDPADLPRQF